MLLVKEQVKQHILSVTYFFNVGSAWRFNVQMEEDAEINCKLIGYKLKY
jgi:hypothetical protein